MLHLTMRSPSRNGTKEVAIVDPEVEKEILKATKRYVATSLFIAVMLFLILVIQALNYLT